jgi:hypothetical protein
MDAKDVVKTQVRKIAIDLGNGGMKAAEAHWSKVPFADKPGEFKDVSEIVTVALPSRVGVGDTNMGALSLGGVGRSKKDEEPHQVRWEGGEYLVGAGVERYAAMLQRFDAARYSDSPEVQALTYALLAQLLDGGAMEVVAVVALPVDLMMSPNVKEVVRGIEAWMVGEHRFTCDGHETCVNIRAIKAMAQPVGAFFAWGLNDRGEWARDDADLTGASVAVLDSGFSTLDLLVVKQGRIEKRFSGGEVLGVRRAAEDVIAAVKAQFGFTMSPAEADNLIRQYLERGKVSMILTGKQQDLRPAIRQALNSLATRTIAFVDERWGNANQFSYVLLAGGGAMVLDSAIRRHIPHAIMLNEPVTANAVGLARLAQRPGVFKGL